MNSDNMTATEKVIEYFKCKVLEGEWNVGDCRQNRNSAT